MMRRLMFGLQSCHLLIDGTFLKSEHLRFVRSVNRRISEFHPWRDWYSQISMMLRRIGVHKPYRSWALGRNLLPKKKENNLVWQLLFRWLKWESTSLVGLGITVAVVVGGIGIGWGMGVDMMTIFIGRGWDLGGRGRGPLRDHMLYHLLLYHHLLPYPSSPNSRLLYQTIGMHHQGPRSIRRIDQQYRCPLMTYVYSLHGVIRDDQD